MHCYYPREDRWEALSQSMSTPRGGVNCAVLGTRLYAMGGFDGQQRLSSVEFLDLESPEKGWRSAPKMKVRRSNFGVTSDGSRIFVIGGFKARN